MALPTKVRETIRKYHLLDAADRVLVAVSGGPDSVCLLAVLHALAKDFGLTLHMAHLDHMFRGEESANEARFAADLAGKLGLPATVERINVPALCREQGLSTQAGARQARYGFLSRVAEETGATRIATGHTATDQAETFLMRLVRGAGTSGLSAIPPRRGNIIRPLIEVTRNEVLDYLKSKDIAFVIDSSNAKSLYTRNRVRMELLPVLTKFNPRIVQVLASEAALLRDEDEAVESHLAALAEEAVLQEEEAVSVKRDLFDTLPPAFRRRLFRKVVSLAGAEPSALSSGNIDDALSFMLSAQTGRTMNLSSRLAVTREYNRFVFVTPGTIKPFSHTVTVPGRTEVAEIGVSIDTRIRGNGPEREHEEDSFDVNYQWQARFDYDKIGPLPTLRNRRAGDRFCPAGMGGKSKKLQDFFVDEKVPKRKRDVIPLFCSGDDILWVVGMRTDERFLSGPETRRELIVRIRKEDA